jgi:ATP-dependent RNA helicase RhlE
MQKRNMTFKELNIIEPVLKALNEKGYTHPTPIQQQAIAPALDNRDILGLAQTGTGKTAAFSLPIIQQLYSNKVHGKKRDIRALILTPTRELAIQINESLNDYTCYTGIRHCVIYGGVKQNAQVSQLKEGIDILVATPGRLLDLMNQNIISLKSICHFVLDEADRMLDMGFIHDIRRLLPKLPKEKQTLFFSATMPASIAALSRSILHNPVKVEVTPVSSVVDTIDQYIYFVEKQEKKDLLITLLRKDRKKSALIFSRTKHGADKIVRILSKSGIGSAAIHGNKSQNARQRALSDFKSHKIQTLIATDIAARGIDIDHLELVINYDLPDVAETYVHRIGRTGRAGNTGMALTFCAQDEQGLLKDIQKLTGKRLTVSSQ